MTKQKCGAKTKSGGICQNWALDNGTGRCRLHGGASLQGTDSPTWKNGLYSKYAHESLKDVLEDLEDVDNDELIDPKNEIRLMQALLIRCKGLKDGAEGID